MFLKLIGFGFGFIVFSVVFHKVGFQVVSFILTKPLELGRIISNRFKKYEEFLSKVDLLLSMDPYEKSKIADALQIVKFQKGDYVLKEVALQL